MIRLVICLALLAATLISVVPIFADPASSTNYQLSQFDMAMATVTSSSTYYGIDEGSIALFETNTTSGTTYNVDGKLGIDGAEGIPVINSVTPGPTSRNFTDESPSFTVSATNSDAQTINYEAKQDGTLKDGPQTTNPLTWALVSGDRGRRTITFNVSDTTGTVTKEQPLYAFRRPTK